MDSGTSPTIRRRGHSARRSRQLRLKGLMKYRLGKFQQSKIDPKIEQQGCEENQIRDGNLSGEVGDETQNQINDCFQIAQALKMQMEVQRKLHEQLEVQRHLQLRIEAQGKYLQSVLKKAQETLVGDDCSSSIGVELAKAVLSDLVSMADNGGPSSSLSVLTDIGGSSFIETEKNLMGNNGRSLECSLTSSENSGQKEEKQSDHESGDANKCNGNPVLLSLMDQCPRLEEKGASSNKVRERKRSGRTIFYGNCAEQTSDKRSPTRMEKTGDHLRKFGLLETFDLNRQYPTEFDAAPKAIIDLN
ncbi:hypothetical protein U1Q18_042308 [Sarracenia purpurea var. burkii]